jgi:hypothetical protein
MSGHRLEEDDEHGLVTETLETQQFIDRLRENIPLDVEQQLLLVFPFVMLIIFGCSQLALFTSTAPAMAESTSNLVAEYGAWTYIPITGFRSALLDEIRLDSIDDEELIEVYDDPVVVSSTWVDEETPPIVVAQLPTNSPEPTDPSDQGSGEPVDNPTDEPSSTQELDPTDEPIPTRTEVAEPTETVVAIATDSPSATQTSTSVPTLPGGPLPTPTDPPTETPTATNTPTDTPIPTNTPPVTNTATSPPPPPNYCANINYNKVSVNKQRSSPDRLWKFYLNIYNDNTIPMFLTSYQVSWTNDSDLHLNRAKAIPNPDTGTRVTIGKNKQSSPSGACTDCPAEFVPQPVSFDAEIYNMFCNDYPCDESNPQNDIPPGTYSFTATGVFTFYPPGGGTVSCPFSKSASVTQ